MNKAQKERNKKVKPAMADLRRLIKKHGLEVMRAATNRYFTAVARVTSLRKRVDEAESEIKKLLGGQKL